MGNINKNKIMNRQSLIENPKSIFSEESDNTEYLRYFEALLATELCQDLPNGITKIMAELATGKIMSCDHCKKTESILFLHGNIGKDFYIHRSFANRNKKPNYFCKKCMNELECMRCFNVISKSEKCKFHCFASQGPYFENKQHIGVRNNAFHSATGFLFPCCNAICIGTFQLPKSQHNGCNELKAHLLPQY